MRRIILTVLVWICASAPGFAQTAPSGTNKTIELTTGQTYTFTKEDWGFVDHDMPSGSFTGVRITSLPTAGALTLEGTPVQANALVSVLPGLAGTNWKIVGSVGDWNSLAVSGDGNTIFGTALNGPLVVSRNRGVTWNQVDEVPMGSAVACSKDGQTIVVASGGLSISSNGGATWAHREAGRGYNRIAVSDSGQIIKECIVKGT